MLFWEKIVKKCSCLMVIARSITDFQQVQSNMAFAVQDFFKQEAFRFEPSSWARRVYAKDLLILGKTSASTTMTMAPVFGSTIKLSRSSLASVCVKTRGCAGAGFTM